MPFALLTQHYLLAVFIRILQIILLNTMAAPGLLLERMEPVPTMLCLHLKSTAISYTWAEHSTRLIMSASLMAPPVTIHARMRGHHLQPERTIMFIAWEFLIQIL